MKETKFLTEREQFVYTKDKYRGPWIAAYIGDLLKDGCLHAFWADRTFSEFDRRQPTCLFFTEDVLDLPDNYQVKNSTRSPDDTDFMKLPFEFEGKHGECWVTCSKINTFNYSEKEELEKSLPGYFKEKPVTKLGFFNEDLNMKFDLVQEGITTNFNSQEIIRIMEDENLNSDTKCRRLFDRCEDYLSHVQWLCFRHTDTWVQYLVDHNFVTPAFKSSWEEDRHEAWNRLDEVVDTAQEISNPTGKRTLFLDNRNWDAEEQPCSLEQSWDVYVVRGECRGSNKEARAENWFTHMKSSVSYIEDQGITQEKPKKRLGFFSENLNESITRNFTTDDQIREVMENPELSLEEKSRRLFDRSPEHVWMFGMCSYHYTQEALDYSEQHTGSTSSIRNADRGPVRQMAREFSIRPATVMCLGNESEPFNLEESYQHYVLGQRNKYNGRTNDYTMRPIAWWTYLKTCVEVFETAAGYRGKRLGFFDK